MACRFLLRLLPAAVLLLPWLGRAETLVSQSISQPSGAAPLINYTITNANPGAIFNSASLNYQDQLGPAFAYALEQNPSLSNVGITTMAQLIGGGSVGVGIDNSGGSEVYNGWNSPIQPETGILSLVNNGLDPDLDYHVWNNTAANPSHDTMKLTYVFGNPLSPDPRLQNLFDFNGNGLVDWEERLITEEQGWARLGLPAPAGARVSGGFVGFMNIDNTYPADLPRYWVLGAWRQRMLEEGRARAGLRLGRTGGQVELRHEALAGLRYQVERSVSLAEGSFQPLGTPVTVPAPQELLHTLSEPGTGPVFYRLRIEVVED